MNHGGFWKIVMISVDAAGGVFVNAGMNPAVSLHPYFKAHPGQIETFRALFPAFVKKAAAEPGCLYYGFSVNGDEIFCREAYRTAEDLLIHLENVGQLLEQALQNADLLRLEVHGPAAELEKLKLPMSSLSPAFFGYETGLDRP